MLVATKAVFSDVLSADDDLLANLGMNSMKDEKSRMLVELFDVEIDDPGGHSGEKIVVCCQICSVATCVVLFVDTVSDTNVTSDTST